MKLYQFVWTVLFIYMGYKGNILLVLLSVATSSMLGYGTFFGGVMDSQYDDYENAKGRRVGYEWFDD